MARFTAEFKSVKLKLLARIEYLEAELAKYDNSDSLNDNYRTD